MADVGLSSINPLGNFHIGSLSTFANVGLVLVLALLIVGLVGVLIFIMSVKKSYWIRIHVFKMVGNSPTRVAVFVARDVAFGMAGDRLWRVAPSSAFSMAFKIVKWLPVGKLQTAPNEFWYWIRKDGEWINFSPSNIDETCSTAVDKEGKLVVKFVQEDMRLQRLATERLLEQRYLNKSFWEKYGVLIGYMLFFLVITICMVIIFFQWSKILDKTSSLVGTLQPVFEQLTKECVTQGSGLVPVPA